MLYRRTPLLALLFAILLALGTVPKARVLGSPDFKVFYTAAQHALHSPENIYKLSPDRYLYPPSTALLLAPFAFSGNFELHQWIWHGFLALLLFLLARESGAALGAMVLLTRYLIITFGYGQINLVVIALLALTGACVNSRRFRPAGSLWILATSLKVYPAVLAPLFLRRERWGAWGGAALGGALLLFMPFVFFGFDRGLTLYSDFFESLQSKGLPLHSHNQSIAALLLRVGTDQEFYLHAVGSARWGLVNLPEAWLRALAWGIGLALTGFSWWRAREKDFSVPASLSAAAFSVLFLSHIVWKDYLLLLFFPLSEIFFRWPRKQSYWLAGSYFLILTLTSHDVAGAPLSTRFDAGSIHLWAAILVWMAWCKR